MKNWIMRMPDPIPLGLTRRVAMVRAIVSASLVKRLFGAWVEAVFTSRNQRLVLLCLVMGTSCSFESDRCST